MHRVLPAKLRSMNLKIYVAELLKRRDEMQEQNRLKLDTALNAKMEQIIDDIHYLYSEAKRQGNTCLCEFIQDALAGTYYAVLFV